MSHAAALSVRRRLERSWSDRDLARCAAILDEVVPANDAAACDPAVLESVVHALRPMTAEAAGQAEGVAEPFATRRADLLRTAAAGSNDLRIALESDAIAAHVSGPAWATALFRYVLLRAHTVGARREGIWETVAFVHWATGHLLRHCQLDEQSVARLFLAVLNADMHLSWERGEPSILKLVMQEDRKALQDGFVAVLSGLAQAGQLTEPEAFLAFDSDGRLAEALDEEIGRLGIRHPGSAALAYAKVHRGALPVEDFLAGIAHLPSLLVGERTAFMVAGERFYARLCRSLADTDPVQPRTIHLTWWLNVDFPREQLGDTGFMVSRVPPFVRGLLAQGQATLVLAATGEASWFTPRWIGWMEGLAAALSCRPERIVYLCQNTRFGDRYRAHCAAHGLRTLFFVAPLNTHLLIEGFRDAPLPPAPKRHFLCFNQRPHLHRAALLLAMKRDGLLERTAMSFNQPIGADAALSGAALAPWLGLDPSAVDARIDAIEPALPLRLDLVGHGVATAADAGYVERFDARLFAETAVYLVTETEMDGPDMCRFTEKTVKGLAAEIPFIVFGNAGVLASLRALGFRTFAPLIDEGYDAIKDPIARFHAAYAEVRRLGAMPLETLAGMRAVLQPVLQHNRETLLEIGPRLHNRLAADLEGMIGV